jgi:hypothetical protein
MKKDFDLSSARTERPVGGQPRFASVTFGRLNLYLIHDLWDDAALLAEQLRQSQISNRTGVGNRASGFSLSFKPGQELFVRRCRRGGFVRFLLDDLYLGFKTRPLAELALAVQAWRRGLPVAEPVGAAVERVLPFLYRGFVLTRPLKGMTLWEFVRTDDEPLVRRHAVEQARQSIEAIHQGGLFHNDLNLHNLFVTESGERLSVTVLDLDKALLFDRPLKPGLRRRNLARLSRSIRKLDPQGQYFDPQARAILTASR